MSVEYRTRSCGAGRREPPRRSSWSSSWSGISSGTGGCDPKSRQSFFSSRQNWDSPQPLTRRRVCLPRLWGEGHTWGRENPNSDEGTYTVVLLIYTYFVMRPHIPVPRDTASFLIHFAKDNSQFFCIFYLEVSWFCQCYSTPQSTHIGRDETE